jgi:hypothetical protein
MMDDEPLATASKPCPTASEPLRHCLRATRHSPPPPSHAPPPPSPCPTASEPLATRHRLRAMPHRLYDCLRATDGHSPRTTSVLGTTRWTQSTVLQRGGLGISFVFLGIAPVALGAGRPRWQPGEGPGGFYAGLRALALALALRDLTTMRGCVLAPRRGVSTTLEDRVRGSSTEKRLGKQGHWW